MTEAAGPPRRAFEGRHRRERHMLDPLHDELGDAVPPANLVVGTGIGVDQQHPDLVAIATVDEARGVEAGDAVPQRQPASGLNKSCVSLGDRQRDAGADERSTTPAPQCDGLAGNEIGAGVAGPGVVGQRKVGIEANDGDPEHAVIVAASWARRWHHGRGGSGGSEPPH